MSQLKYNPKELLSILVDIDKQLKSVVDENCPARYLNVSGNIENGLEDFLIESNLLEDDIGYISSHIALLQLSREFEKTVQIVIETNDLQAHYDFNSLKEGSLNTKESKTSKVNYRDLLLGTLIGVILALCFFLLFN